MRRIITTVVSAKVIALLRRIRWLKILIGQFDPTGTLHQAEKSNLLVRSTNMPWVWDYFSHYRMNDEIINKLLKEIWGNYDFKVTVCSSLAISELI